MKPLLLWTERPRLLPREVPTHAWMALNRPWETLGLELVYDNAPGDWTHYSDVFRATWNRAYREQRALLNVESDVVPTMLAFRQLLACSEEICTVPYEINHFDGIEIGKHLTGCVVEKQVAGGWDAHFATEGEQWAANGDLGFIRFRPTFELPDSWRLTTDDGMLNLLIFGHFRTKMVGPYNCKLHLHWPSLRNNHVYWDEADFEHHPSWQWNTLAKMHRKYLAPGSENRVK